ncbi:MAG: Crp/Fnr family transcriptional regulator [Chloroflexi bacterium]|nr:Crp/Fnr family transcriptional regulator [Chloroflexota bacterium]
MDSTAALDALKSQPYFVALDHVELERLARTLVERSYDKDQIIFLEGEPCQGLYILREGLVKIYKLSDEGREQILRFMSPGESFNEVAVFDGGPNPANVSAVQASTLWIVPSASVVDLITRRPEVALAVIRNLGARIRHLVTLVEDLALRHVTARLAKLLLETATSRQPALTQQEMASRLGTVREMIGRSLRQMESKGLIKTERGKIVIVDRKGLEKLV